MFFFWQTDHGPPRAPFQATQVACGKTGNRKAVLTGMLAGDQQLMGLRGGRTRLGSCKY